MAVGWKADRDQIGAGLAKEATVPVLGTLISTPNRACGRSASFHAEAALAVLVGLAGRSEAPSARSAVHPIPASVSRISARILANGISSQAGISGRAGVSWVPTGSHILLISSTRARGGRGVIRATPGEEDHEEEAS